ncbi:MAG: electron-transfer flavoprotein:ubiquinone oxidoreductase [Bdellovibrionota bacterium]
MKVTDQKVNSFSPITYQNNFDDNKVIIRDAPNAEAVPMDVLFVGAGPAGLSGAIELTKLVKKERESNPNFPEIQIGVLEKAAGLGEHNLSGAVLNPIALKELFPDLKNEDFPLRTQVQGDEVYYMSESSAMRIPTPPTMHNSGNFVVSICELVRWLGEKAESAGVNIFAGFPADSLLVEGDKVIGVRTTPTGLGRDGNPGGANYMPPTDLTANVTVLTEGTRGNLTQGYLKWQNLASKNPQIYALGVKELWETTKVPKGVIHTLGYPLPKSAFGGSWMYPMGENLVSFGLVVGLDYKEHNLDVHNLLQKMKEHPLFKKYLDGGKIVEWGAKTIPEGGFYALPSKLHGDGLLLAGDCVGMVNVPALKGIHYAMKSGIIAARTIFEAIKKNDYSKNTLASYDEEIKKSYIWKDLHETRNMRLAFKSGFYAGGMKAGLMTLTKGCFPGGYIHAEEDAQDPKDVVAPSAYKPKLSKVDAVFLAGNKTRDDIPTHLKIDKDIPKAVAEMYSHLCPAGVYEISGDQLVINAPNCIDCKATDVIGPRWTPREGGSGPSYRKM